MTRWTTMLLAALVAAAGPEPKAQAQEFVNFTTKSHRLEILTDAFDLDYRWVWCGDSFSMISTSLRLPWGALMAWPTGAPYEAVFAPATSTPTFMKVFTLGTASAAHPFGSNSKGYRPLNGVNMNYAQPLGSEWFGLPNSGAIDYFFNSAYTMAGSTKDQFIRLQFNSNSLATSANGPLFGGSPNVRFRLFWRLTNDPVDSITSFQVDDNPFVGSRVTVPLQDASRGRWWKGQEPDSGLAYPHEPGQLNAHHVDLATSLPASLDPQLGLASPVGDSVSFGFYGALLRGETGPGPMFQSVSDKSWDYAGLGTNEQATLETPKRFTDEQFLNYMDLTTVRRDQRCLFVHHIAIEDLPEAVIQEHTEAWVQRCRWVCEQIGLPEPRFLILGQFRHWIYANGNLNSDVNVSIRNNNALLEVAKQDPGVAFASMYALTDGVLFNQSPAAVSWLAANGGTDFTFGSGNGPYNFTQPPYSGRLLDPTLVHIAGTPESAFFAELIRDEMSRACAANCDMSTDPGTGDPTLDIFDFLCFQNAFLNEEPFANCDGSFDPVTRLDTFDVFDFLCFQNRFAAGCP